MQYYYDRVIHENKGDLYEMKKPVYSASVRKVYIDIPYCYPYYNLCKNTKYSSCYVDNNYRKYLFDKLYSFFYFYNVNLNHHEISFVLSLKMIHLGIKNLWFHTALFEVNLLMTVSRKKTRNYKKTVIKSS